MKNLKNEQAKEFEEKYGTDPDDIMLQTDEEWAESQDMNPEDIIEYDDWDLNEDIYQKYYDLVGELQEINEYLESAETISFLKRIKRVRENLEEKISPEDIEHYGIICYKQVRKSKLEKQIKNFGFRYRKRKNPGRK